VNHAEQYRLKVGLAEMLKGGVIMDVMTADHARIGEEAGSPGVAEFSALIGGKPNLLWIEGTEFRRVEAGNT